MIVSLRQWYLARSAREQRMLLMMLVIAVPIMLWAAIIRPLDQAYQRALDAHLQAVDRNGAVRSLAKQLESGPTGAAIPSPVGPDLTLVVAEAAAQSGLTLDSNAASGADQVAVSIAQASPTVAVEWLNGLEARGLSVEELRMVPGQGGTVSVTARLGRTGA